MYVQNVPTDGLHILTARPVALFVEAPILFKVLCCVLRDVLSHAVGSFQTRPNLDVLSIDIPAATATDDSPPAAPDEVQIDLLPRSLNPRDMQVIVALLVVFENGHIGEFALYPDDHAAQLV